MVDAYLSAKTKKAFYLTCFLLFGLVAGIVVAWHDRRYDTPFLLNLPGYMLGQVFMGLWVRFVSDVIPWIFKFPQGYVFASTLFWGLIGTLLSLFVKPKIIDWIVGIYLLLFGGLTITFYLLS
jgi:hypothetical protein